MANTNLSIVFRRSAKSVLALGIVALALRGQTAKHPLDPLNFQEYWTALEVLRENSHMNEATRFSIINLREPAKNLVWAWSPGKDFPREAFAVVRQGADTYEAVIDLKQRRLTSWTKLHDVQPNWLDEEFQAMVGQVKQHPDFLAALKKRGITDLTFLRCSGVPPGYFDTEEQRGRRISHIQCSDAHGVRNGWPKQIPGLTAVVDLNAKRVLRVVDEGVIPVAETVADYDPASIGEPRKVPGPIRVDQPLGPGFRLDGHIVEWQKWRFHVRTDQRVGTIISTVTYQDGGSPRPILYEGHLSEIFVPYMDPAFDWYRRNFLDAGENASGIVKPLLRGLDCPAGAVYLDALVASDGGRPRPVPDAICLFEREAGDMAWRHFSEEPESRRKRDLVVRNASVLGNYDYVFDWAFQQDGSIRIAVGATGIAEVKSSKTATAGEQASATDGHAGAEAPDAYGRFVDKNIIAVNHDHYFSFRIDLDVDGPINSFLNDRLVSKTLPPEHPRRSIWVRQPSLARTESDGMLHMDMERPALWRVLSSTRKNHVGYPTSYQVMPGMTAGTLLSADDFPRRRAGFIDHTLWVTPYRYEERYAAGDYPTLSTPGQGLPAWTKANRPIEQTDIVLWYTIGMHHMVRAEDWPVMPTLWHSFELRPFDFFDRNPALDLPRQ
ncbi:MAG: tyramine oxidase [Acidobacteriia bacterium]|nr:tyramine oxidase [Terriglobia bacterium]